MIDKYNDFTNSRQNLNFFLPIYVPKQVTDAWTSEAGLSNYIDLVDDAGNAVGNFGGRCHQTTTPTMMSFTDPKRQ